MKAPLEFNEGLKKASAEGKLDNNPKFKAAVDAAPVNMNYDSPAKQVAGMMQPNQMIQSPINPVALGGMQPQMPSVFGQPQPGVSYNNLMPNPSTPLNQGVLSAKTAKQYSKAEAKRLEAQRKAKEEKEKKAKKEIDPVSGKTMFISAPKRTYSESSSKIIYNEDGSVSRKQTLK